MPLGWWHSALAVPIQDHLIGIQLLKNEDAVHRALTGNESAGLLSAAFLDLYLPWQPNLLLALLCLLITSLLSLLLLLGMLVRTRFSRFLAVNGQMGGGTSEDEKTPQRQPRFRLLLCFCVVLWLLLLAGSVLFSSTLVELISVGGGHGQEEPMAASEALLMDEEMAAAAAGREQRSEDGAAGEMLGKFEELRELGYQFRSLLSPSLFSGWMSFGFVLLLLLLLCSLLTSFLAILIGLNQRFRHYKPMDHLSAKGFVNAAAQRVRRLLMVTGIALLCASPALIALSSALLVHSHGHSAVCELEQRMSQDAAMTAHILAKFSEEERTTTLPELMAEFSKEREALNGENCRRERAPLEGLWSSGLWLAFCAAPLGLCLLLLSDGWATGDGEGSVSLRAYVPGWLQNSALTPDAYASIPELQQSQFYPGTGGRHPSSTLSQCSFGTGTFVYKKY